MSFFVALGDRVIACLNGIGLLSLFLLRMLAHMPALFRRPLLLLRALLSVGVLSLPIILVSGVFVGMVLAYQGYLILVRFGAEEALGMMVALSLMWELGSVVTALLFAGRAGSAVTAEIGLMKTTEQLDSMEMMAIDPFDYVLLPRFVASLIAMPLLSALFVAAGILSGFFVSSHMGVDPGTYWSQMQSSIYFYDDVVRGVLIKGFVFGVVVAAISIFQGYYCVPTSRGMGEATTKTVVYSSLTILGFDFILTVLMFGA